MLAQRAELPSRAGPRRRQAIPLAGRWKRPGVGIDSICLAGLSVIVGSVVFAHGGTSRPPFEASLVALGLFAIGFWIFRPAGLRAPSLPWHWTLPLVGFSLLVALQVVPLPVELLEVISPARAGLAAAATPVLGNARFVPLSVEPGTTFAHLVRILSYLTVFLLVRNLGWRLGSQRWMLALPPVAIAVAEAGWAISQWTAGAGQMQATGTFVNPNHFAALLGLAAPLSVALVYTAWTSGKAARRPRRDLLVASAIGVLAIIGVGVVLSLSRMGLVSTIAGVCASLALILNRRRSEISWTVLGKAAAVLVGIAILATLVYLPPDKLIGRFGFLTSGEGLAAHSRWPLWHETTQLIGEYPLFGCGLGAFAAPFLKHKISEPMLFDEYAHNDYLQLLAETGIAGFALLLWAPIVALRPVWTGLPLTRIDRAMMAGVGGAFAALALHSLTDFNLYIPANAMVAAWIAGIAASVQDTSFRGVQNHANTARSRLTLYLPVRQSLRG